MVSLSSLRRRAGQIPSSGVCGIRAYLLILTITIFLLCSDNLFQLITDMRSLLQYLPPPPPLQNNSTYIQGLWKHVFGLTAITVFVFTSFLVHRQALSAHKIQQRVVS